MRVLFDQGTPVPLRRFLEGHRVSTAYELGWMHQQNLANRVLAIVVLSSASWPRIEQQVEQVVRAVDEASPGSYAEVAV